MTAAAERLSTLARLLLEQAEQQDRASGGSGQGASGGAGGPAGRSTAGGPDVVDAVRNALSGTGPRGGWAPNLSAVSRPRGTGPGDLTWWAVDEATDWASDV